jgi:hypothetical protein
MQIKLQLEDRLSQKKKKRVDPDGVTEGLDQILESSLQLLFLTVAFLQIKFLPAIDSL